MPIPKMSIAMCTYNAEAYLPEQLDSLARQTRLPDELIICDDNSSDGTMHVIGAFADSAPFPVRLFRNCENLGSTRNFEQAIALCEGDIIALCDQDDVWKRDKLKLIEQAFLASRKTQAVFSNANVVSSDLLPLGYTLWDTYCFKEQHKKKMLDGKGFDVLLNHNVVTGATLAFRAGMRKTILPIPPTWVHDKWIAMIISINEKLDFIDECLVDYRQHEKQQIGGINKNCINKIMQSKKVSNYQAQIQELELLLEYMRQLKVANSSVLISKVTDKISHLENRETIYRCRIFRKVYKILLELLKGRYHSYSDGYFSACKDLFLIL